MTELADAPEAGTHPLRHVAFLAALLAVALLVVGTIGPPLFGRGSLLATDMSTLGYPWRAYLEPGEANTGDHGPVTDTVDASYPTRVAVSEAARDGDLFGWNPFTSGGVPAASESASGSLTPFGLLYVVLPSWFAAAAIKLAQMAVAVGFTFLFGRRIGLDRVPAVFAGAAFAGSAFLVMWSNWPQAELAALIAPLFWATERYLQGPSATRAAPIALVVALMLLGNFPAVVGYALYALVGYVAVRLLFDADQPLRRRITVGGGAGVGVLAGVLLVAAVMLPFAARLGDLDLESREQQSGSNIGIGPLVTAVAPKALGLSTDVGGYFGPRSQVEVVSFVGMTTALLAVAALCLPRPRRTPPGTRLALGLVALVLGLATYGGGVALDVLQQFPVFSTSFIGRTTSIMGFAVAVLAGLGLQSLVERGWPEGWRARATAVLVLVAALGVAVTATRHARNLASGVGRSDQFLEALRLPIAIGVVAVVLFVVVRAGSPRLRQVATVGVVALLVIESLALSLPLLPNEDEELLFPETPGITFLAENVGHERVAPQGLNLFASATTLFGIRSATGHAFTAETWKSALKTADPNVFAGSPTLSQLRDEESVITSPMLDRLGARWFAAGAAHVPLGVEEDRGLAEASCDRPVELDRPATVTIPAANGVRGVQVRTCGTVELPGAATLDAQAVGPGGSTTARVHLPRTVAEGEVAVAIPGDDLGGDGEITVTLDMAASDGRALSLATDDEGEVAVDVTRPADDGLRLAYADDLRIYERTRALPRIRWAGSSTVVDDPGERLDLLGEGSVPDDTVVLSEPGAEGSGAPGDVEVLLDAPTAITVEVESEGDGYLVVADALQTDWVATVDGESADLVAADHAGVAVAVPEGTHTVEIRYRPRGPARGRRRLGRHRARAGRRAAHRAPTDPARPELTRHGPGVRTHPAGTIPRRARTAARRLLRHVRRDQTPSGHRVARGPDRPGSPG